MWATTDRCSLCTWEECNRLNTLICNFFFIMPPNVSLGRSQYWFNKNRLMRHSDCVLPAWVMWIFFKILMVLRIELEKRINTQREENKQTCAFELYQIDTCVDCQLWSQNYCEPLQVQMSHCSLFELACVPAVPSDIWHAQVTGIFHPIHMTIVILHKIHHLSFYFVFITH